MRVSKIRLHMQPSGILSMVRCGRSSFGIGGLPLLRPVPSNLIPLSLPFLLNYVCLCRQITAAVWSKKVVRLLKLPSYLMKLVLLTSTLACIMMSRTFKTVLAWTNWRPLNHWRKSQTSHHFSKFGISIRTSNTTWWQTKTQLFNSW